MSKRKMTVLSSIPVACALLEIVITAMCLRYNSETGTWMLKFGVFRALAAAGFFFLPYPCLLVECIGMIMAVRDKHKKLMIAFAVEIIISIIVMIFSMREFYYALSI